MIWVSDSINNLGGYLMQLNTALDLYASVTRRDREDYINHPKRMIEYATGLGWDNPSLLLTIALHDVLEVADVSLQMLDEMQVDFDVLEAVELLTCKIGETSEQHFRRVLFSNNKLALQTKYVDCLDNAVMEEVDKLWYREVLKKSAKMESEKYKVRSEQVMQLLTPLL